MISIEAKVQISGQSPAKANMKSGGNNSQLTSSGQRTKPEPSTTTGQSNNLKSKSSTSSMSSLTLKDKQPSRASRETTLAELTTRQRLKCPSLRRL